MDTDSVEKDSLLSIELTKHYDEFIEQGYSEEEAIQYILDNFKEILEGIYHT